MRRTPLPLGIGLRPLSVRISDACRMTGIGRSKLYELIKDGAVEVIKVGAITLVPMSSIQALLDRGHRGDAEFPRRGLAEVMHPFVANAILTASIAGTSELVRQDLLSQDYGTRSKAEDSIVERMTAALYEPHDETSATARRRNVDRTAG